MIYNMKLTPEPFELTRSGKKTIEMRLLDEKRQKICVGDEILFSKIGSENDSFSTKVVSLSVFPSFRELYANLPLLKCGYTIDTISNARPEDMNRYYSPEEQSKYNVVGIEIRLV